MTKELLVLFATICINCAMFLASAEAARFGSSGYFLTMDVPVFLEQAETMGYPTVAKFANQDDGSIVISCMDNPEYRDVIFGDDENFLSDIVSQIKYNDEALGFKMEGHKLINLTHGHKGLVVYFSGPCNRTVLYFILHAQQYYIGFTDNDGRNLVTEKVDMCIDSIKCSKCSP